MPTPEINARIIEQLQRMDQLTQQMGLGPMPPEELRRAHDRIYQGVSQAMQQMQGLSAPQQPVPMGWKPIPRFPDDKISTLRRNR